MNAGRKATVPRAGRVPGGKRAERFAPRPANDTELEPETPELAGAGAEAMPEALEGPVGVEALEERPEAVTFPDEPIELPGASAPPAALDDEAESRSAFEESAEDDDEDEEDEQEEPEEATRTPVAVRRPDESEPQSFLAMYFRDMAELEVLRPEQEFETARVIEELEHGLWRQVLGFAPAAGWVADLVEQAMMKPFADFKAYRVIAEKARGKAAAGVRNKLDRCTADLAVTLKEQDIDRLFIDAVVAELAKVDQALRHERPVDLPFATNTKAFRDWMESSLRKTSQVKRAKNEFVKANLRLVVSIARRFNHGRLPLPDLIQEGNIGLMKAVERYDYRRGFRFSTYASWWIRHAISRALADKGRAVRLPVHMIDAYHRIAKSERELQSKLERPATTEEIAGATGIETEKLEKMKTFLSETPVSLDRPISDEDGRRLIDVLVDPNEAPSPPDQMMTSETQGEMLKLLGGLKPIEADILRKRFGLVNDRERTLKEIGDEYHLSRERVRQLQEQALGKMRKAMSKREIL